MRLVDFKMFKNTRPSRLTIQRAGRKLNDIKKDSQQDQINNFFESLKKK